MISLQHSTPLLVWSWLLWLRSAGAWACMTAFLNFDTAIVPSAFSLLLVLFIQFSVYQSQNWVTLLSTISLWHGGDIIRGVFPNYLHLGRHFIGTTGHISRQEQEQVIGTSIKEWQILVPQIDPSVPKPVVQSRRRPLLGPSPGWKRLLALSHLRHY